MNEMPCEALESHTNLMARMRWFVVFGWSATMNDDCNWLKRLLTLRLEFCQHLCIHFYRLVDCHRGTWKCHFLNGR